MSIQLIHLSPCAVVVLTAHKFPILDLGRSCRADLRSAHRLGHAVEDHHALAAAAGRKRLFGCTDTAVDVLPVVRHPDVPGRIDVDINLHLQATTDVAAGRRNLVARLHAGRTVFGPDAAQLRDRTARRSEVGDPDIVIAIHGRSPWPRETAARERRARIRGAVRPQQRDAATIGASLAARTWSLSGSRTPLQHP